MIKSKEETIFYMDPKIQAEEIYKKYSKKDFKQFNSTILDGKKISIDNFFPFVDKLKLRSSNKNALERFKGACILKAYIMDKEKSLDKERFFYECLYLFRRLRNTKPRTNEYIIKFEEFRDIVVSAYNNHSELPEIIQSTFRKAYTKKHYSYKPEDFNCLDPLSETREQMYNYWLENQFPKIVEDAKKQGLEAKQLKFGTFMIYLKRFKITKKEFENRRKLREEFIMKKKGQILKKLSA